MVVVASCPGRRRASVATSSVLDRPRSCSRSSTRAVTTSDLRALIAPVRALRALERATRNTRIISTRSSPALGVPVASPEMTARAAASASAGSDLAVDPSGLAVRADHLYDSAVASSQVPGEGGTVGAGALYPERFDTAERVGPGDQLAVAYGRRRDRRVADTPAEAVDGYRHMGVFVGIDTYDHTGRCDPCDCGHAISLFEWVVLASPARRADSTVRGP